VPPWQRSVVLGRTIKSSKKGVRQQAPVTVYTGAGKKIGTVKSQKVTGVVGYNWTLAARIAIKLASGITPRSRRLASCGGAKSNHLHVQERAPAASGRSRAALGRGS
jgi:hypothetical protein